MQTLKAGVTIRLAHPVHVEGHLLPAGAAIRVLSVHRLHVRARVRLAERELVLRLPMAMLGGQE